MISRSSGGKNSRIALEFTSLIAKHGMVDGFLDDCGMEGPDLRRRASEAMIYGSLVAHGVPSDLPLHSDGAGQFDVFTRSGCWLHAARPLERFIPVSPEQVEEQHQLLCRFWQLYRELKAFKEQPESYKAEKQTRFAKGFVIWYKPRQSARSCVAHWASWL